MTKVKEARRVKIKYRVRNKISGTAERPRMSVFRSNKQIYVQIINDEVGSTLVAASSLGLDAESFRRVANLLLTENRKIEFPFRRPLERQNDLSAVHAVLRGTGRRRAKQVSRDNQIRIRSANSLWTFRSNFTGTHITNFTTNTGHTEATLGLLLIKTIKGGIKTKLLLS